MPFPRLSRLLPLALALVCLGGCGRGLPAAAGEPGLGAVSIQVRATPVDLDPEDPKRTRLGELTFLGGLELTADHPAFGGFSGLWISPDGERLAAVSDRGWWLAAAIVRREGRMVGLGDARLAPLPDRQGGPLRSRWLWDAEALARDRDSWLVGFEHAHRLWRYPAGPGPEAPAGPPRELPLPPWLGEAPDNAGLEALTRLPDGRLLALCEDCGHDRATRGGLWDGTRWHRLELRLEGGFLPTDAAALADGRVLILERRFTVIDGPAARLGLLPAGAVRPGARLEPRTLAQWGLPLTVDNMEGLAVQPTPSGEIVHLISDDNFNPVQRTLWLWFALPGAAGAE